MSSPKIGMTALSPKIGMTAVQPKHWTEYGSPQDRPKPVVESTRKNSLKPTPVTPCISQEHYKVGILPTRPTLFEPHLLKLHSLFANQRKLPIQLLSELNCAHILPSSTFIALLVLRFVSPLSSFCLLAFFLLASGFLVLVRLLFIGRLVSLHNVESVSPFCLESRFLDYR